MYSKRCGADTRPYSIGGLRPVEAGCGCVACARQRACEGRLHRVGYRPPGEACVQCSFGADANSTHLVGHSAGSHLCALALLLDDELMDFENLKAQENNSEKDFLNHGFLLCLLLGYSYFNLPNNKIASCLTTICMTPGVTRTSLIKELQF